MGRQTNLETDGGVGETDRHTERQTEWVGETDGEADRAVREMGDRQTEG